VTCSILGINLAIGKTPSGRTIGSQVAKDRHEVRDQIVRRKCVTAIQGTFRSRPSGMIAAAIVRPVLSADALNQTGIIRAGQNGTHLSCHQRTSPFPATASYPRHQPRLAGGEPVPRAALARRLIPQHELPSRPRRCAAPPKTRRLFRSPTMVIPPVCRGVQSPEAPYRGCRSERPGQRKTAANRAKRNIGSIVVRALFSRVAAPAILNCLRGADADWAEQHTCGSS
jgi:hypothetical protein